MSEFSFSWTVSDICWKQCFQMPFGPHSTFGKLFQPHTLGDVTLLSVSQRYYWSFINLCFYPFVHLISQLILTSHLLEARWCKGPGVQPSVLNLCSLTVLLLSLPALSEPRKAGPNLVNFVSSAPTIFTHGIKSKDVLTSSCSSKIYL